MSAIVLEDARGGEDWVRRLHVMAARDEEVIEVLANIPNHATIVERRQDELRNYHLFVAWPLREAVRMHFANPECHWDMVIWWIGQDKISQAMLDAGVAYWLQTGKEPLAAFIRRLPTAAGEFAPGARAGDVEVCGMSLVEVDWIRENFIVVSGGGNQEGR